MASDVRDLPEELFRGLCGEMVAQRRFTVHPVSYKMAYLKWIGGAKKSKTRQSRIKGTIRGLQDGDILTRGEG